MVVWKKALILFGFRSTSPVVRPEKFKVEYNNIAPQRALHTLHYILACYKAGPDNGALNPNKTDILDIDPRPILSL